MFNKPLNKLKKRGKSKNLIVIIHGYNGSPSSMKYIQKITEQSDLDADIYLPKLPFHKIFSLDSPIIIAKELLADIDLFWTSKTNKDPEGYEEIKFIGTSFGALIARKIFVLASGEQLEAPFEKAIENKEIRDWSSKVERIILLAGANKGWSLTKHLSFQNSILFPIGLVIAKVLDFFKLKLTILYVRNGAPFVTELRIQWLYLQRKLKKENSKIPITIQLLGSNDTIVAPEDNIDLISGSDFIYLDVPNSNHRSILEMDDSKFGKKRSEIFNLALIENEKELIDIQEVPTDLNNLIQPQPEVKDVVFVMHGIRDEGYWTHKIARRIKTRAKQQFPKRVFATETSSYGYFPIIGFLLTSQREKKVHWLMEEYIEALAYYPNAKFSYVGHSNGTYILAKALQNYGCCRFKNVVFASSVVRSDYDWDNIINQDKVKNVLNFVATNDFVVAWAPYIFEKIGILNLGGAGHVGFKSKAIQQIKYVKGSHSASIHEDNWDTISDFIINGSATNINTTILQDHRPKSFKFFNLIGQFGVLIAALILMGIGYGIWCWGYPDLSNVECSHIGIHPECNDSISKNSSYGSSFTVAFLIIYFSLVLRFLKRI